MILILIFFPSRLCLSSCLDLKSKIDVRHYYLAEGAKNQFYLLALHSLSLQWPGSNVGTAISSCLLIKRCDADLCWESTHLGFCYCIHCMFSDDKYIMSLGANSLAFS